MHRWNKNKKAGFTIVELLIVIVVIGILAAITIVAYNGIQNRANDNAVRADLNNFAKIMEIQKADTGTYPATLTPAMGFKFSRSSYGQDFQNRNARYCYNSATDSYVLMANSKSGNYFKVQNSVIQTATTGTYGYNICGLVGLIDTNPSQDGYLQSISPQWAAWTN